MKLNALFMGVVPLLFLGCSNPADDVPVAEVAPAQAAQPALPSAGEGAVFVFSPESSKVEFVGSKVTGSHDGGFHKFAGEFRVENGRLADAGNKLVIDASSLWSDNNRLTAHLKSADFFDVERYPTATFITTSVAPSGNQVTVTGNLTLHGITKQISFPAQVRVSEDRVQVTSEFVLDRFDFEMRYSGRADDLIRKEVVVKLDLQAVPGQANFEQFTPAAAL